MRCFSLLLSFEDGETFREAKIVSLCCKKQQREIYWLNFTCTSFFFLASRSGHGLQRRQTKICSYKDPFNPAAQTQCTLFLVPWMTSHGSCEFKDSSVTSHRLCIPLCTNASELCWPFRNTTFFACFQGGLSRSLSALHFL